MVIRTYSILYIWSEILHLSRYVLLKSETTSPPKLIPSDCITLSNLTYEIVASFLCLKIIFTVAVWSFQIGAIFADFRSFPFPSLSFFLTLSPFSVPLPFLLSFFFTSNFLTFRSLLFLTYIRVCIVYFVLF